MERMFFIALTTCMSFSEYGDPPAPRPQHTHIYTHIQRMRAPHIMFVIRKHGANFVCVLCMRQWHMPSMLYVAHEKKLLLLFHHMQSNGSRGGGGGGGVYTVLVGKKREKSPRKQQRDGGTQPTIDHAPGPSPWLSFFFLAEKTRDLLPPNWFSMQDKGGSIVQTRRFIFSTIEKENAPQGPLDYPVGNSFRACKGRGKQPPISACLSLLLLLSCLLFASE